MPITINRDKIADSADAISASSDLIARTGLKNASMFQVAIFEHFDEQLARYQAGLPTSSLLVTAVAGSGKTTTIVAAANLIPTNLKTTFLAFNKSIADELKKRLPAHVEAQTLNALGFRRLLPYVKALGCVVDPYKFCQQYRTSKIIRSMYDFKTREKMEKHVKFLVNQCKSMGVIPVGVNDGWAVDGMTSTDETLQMILTHYGEVVDPVIRPTVFAMTREVLAKSWSEANIYETNCIDFDDQKWLTVCKRPNGHPLTSPVYDVVIIDEAQDVNSVDIELIRMVLKPNGIVIGVGDGNQAIYGFRGADTKALQKFGEFFNAKTLPLSITYRCATAIVDYAKALVPSIQAAPNAAVGEVAHLQNYGAATFAPGDMVLCRNNAPLVDLAYKLIQKGIPVQVKGRDIGEKLVTLIEDCVGTKVWEKIDGKNVPTVSVQWKTTQQLVDALIQWKDTQIDAIRTEDVDNETAVQSVLDRVDTVMVFIKACVDGQVSSVIKMINDMFSDRDSSEMVVFSSIHKAKGLEADRVFMYDPSCLYPWWVPADSWQFAQEKNLDYVARTRAKNFYGTLPKDGWVDQ